MYRRLIVVALLGITAFAMFSAEDCGSNKNLDSQAKTAVKERTNSFDRAQKLYPVPELENFPLRKALVDFSVREDAINHPWYTYLLGMNGNIFGYYVTKTPPISACNFLSSTQSYIGDKDGNVPASAPSIDGQFYGGSGAVGGCGWFFFDYSTDAMFLISPSQQFHSVDQPLKLDVQPPKINVQ